MSSTRLALALTTSGLVLGCTAFGAWGFLPSAILAPAPLLLAVRVLPLRVGLPLAVLVGAITRFVCARATLAGAELGTAVMVSSLLWCGPFLLDRLCATWLRRVGFLAFPCAALVLSRVGVELLPFSTVQLLAHPAHAPVLDLWSADVSRSLMEWVLWLFASVTAGLASVHNWHVPDPFTQDEREDGLKAGGTTALALFILVFVGGFIRLRGGSTPSPKGTGNDEVVIFAALGLVALCVVAVTTRRAIRAARG